MYKQSVDLLNKFKRERFVKANAAARIARLWKTIKTGVLGGEGGKKSDGDSDRADSPAPPTGKEDGSVADSEDSGVLVEAPVEREK